MGPCPHQVPGRQRMFSHSVLSLYFTIPCLSTKKRYFTSYQFRFYIRYHCLKGYAVAKFIKVHESTRRPKQAKLELMYCMLHVLHLKIWKCKLWIAYMYILLWTWVWLVAGAMAQGTLLVIPSFDVSPHYGDRAAGSTGSSRSILFCLKHNYFHHGDRVQRNLDWASSHGLTHSIVNPLMSTRPIFFLRATLCRAQMCYSINDINTKTQSHKTLT